LNPFGNDEFLKLEKENYDENGRLRDLWFYGISAKRYVLYTINEKGEPKPVKWSSHGLGHLLHEDENDWEKQLWTNILRYAYGRVSKEQLLGKYRDEYAIAKLALTKPSLLRKVKAINSKHVYQKMRPFNFVLIGSPAMFDSRGRPIIPVASFVRPYDLAPYQPFIDAKSGRFYKAHAELYWKTLDKVVEEYVDHPESKFVNGDRTGKMKKRQIVASDIKYVGKESNELEDSETFGVFEHSYVTYHRERLSFSKKILPTNRGACSGERRSS